MVARKHHPNDTYLSQLLSLIDSSSERCESALIASTMFKRECTLSWQCLPLLEKTECHEMLHRASAMYARPQVEHRDLSLSLKAQYL